MQFFTVCSLPNQEHHVHVCVCVCIHFHLFLTSLIFSIGILHIIFNKRKKLTFKYYYTYDWFLLHILHIYCIYCILYIAYITVNFKDGKEVHWSIFMVSSSVLLINYLIFKITLFLKQNILVKRLVFGDIKTCFQTLFMSSIC